MVSDIDDGFLGEITPGYGANSIDDSHNNDINSEHIENNSLANKKAQAQAQKNLLARKRIDELREKKRLKELLDDSEDW